MVVCRDCLMAIISRGELDKGYEVIEVDEHCTCDWCDEPFTYWTMDGATGEEVLRTTTAYLTK